MAARHDRDDRHRQSNYAGVLLHDGTASVAETEAALRDIHFVDVQVVKDPALVSQLVPSALQQDASSWLVLYSPRDASSDAGPRDALVLPFPNGEPDVVSNESRRIGDNPFRLLEIIRGSIFTKWTPAAGVSNLMDSSAPDEEVPRFELLHSNSPLFELGPATRASSLPPARGPMAPPENRNPGREIGDIFREAAELRAQLQTQPPANGNSAEHEQRVEQLTNQLAELNNRLARQLVRTGAKRVVPPIVERYRGIMDRETARFLISAATVAAFIKDNPELASDLDYSLPGSGVCKAFEREIKTCLAPHIFKQPREFMLGEVVTKLGSKAVAESIRPRVDASLGGYLVGSGPSDLPAQTKDINSIRRQVAHIDSVSPAQFEELWQRCLNPESSPKVSTLGRILTWKQQQRDFGDAM